MSDGEITDLITARSKFEEDMSLQFTPCGNQIAIHIASIFEVKVLFIQTLKKSIPDIFDLPPT